ncbi:MAG: class I SAM-dependent methyltransferase [Thermoleophilaceae bacterium]
MSDASSELDREQRIAAVGYDYAARENEHVRECNLCGSAHHVEVSRQDRYGFPARLRICATCGLGFLSPRLTAAEYGYFYESVYRPLVSAHHGRLIDAASVQAEQHDYARELGDFLDHTLDEAPATILDVGGSTGVIAGALAERLGIRATVLDPAPEELVVAERAGMETIEGFAEDYDPDGRRWELVLLCQTIDHLLDVRRTLTAIREMIADGGHAYVDVVDLLFALRRQGRVDAAVKIDHPHYLTRATALAFFARAGLRVVAERVSDDAHLFGFLLRRAEPLEPDWSGLRAGADALLDEVSQQRARA